MCNKERKQLGTVGHTHYRATPLSLPIEDLAEVLYVCVNGRHSLPWGEPSNMLTQQLFGSWGEDGRGGVSVAAGEQGRGLQLLLQQKWKLLGQGVGGCGLEKMMMS